MQPQECAPTLTPALAGSATRNVDKAGSLCVIGKNQVEKVAPKSCAAVKRKKKDEELESASRFECPAL
ncbi:hypothetical protein P3G55_27175, partial [Leptospira sp. 96542]|nr:hypothetical protein [Leptospira sp. 96542]